MDLHCEMTHDELAVDAVKDATWLEVGVGVGVGEGVGVGVGVG